jgi:zinc transport system ATP-binding protein
MKRQVGALSGGELQRVLLALAMLPQPDLLLLDEPVSAVDSNGLKLFYDIVSSIRKSYHVSVIMVTHELAGIWSHADRIIVLNRIIIAEGTPAEVLSYKKTEPIPGTAI